MAYRDNSARPQAAPLFELRATCGALNSTRAPSRATPVFSPHDL